MKGLKSYKQKTLIFLRETMVPCPSELHRSSSHNSAFIIILDFFICHPPFIANFSLFSKQVKAKKESILIISIVLNVYVVLNCTLSSVPPELFRGLCVELLMELFFGLVSLIQICYCCEFSFFHKTATKKGKSLTKVDKSSFLFRLTGFLVTRYTRNVLNGIHVDRPTQM